MSKKKKYYKQAFSEVKEFEHTAPVPKRKPFIKAVFENSKWQYIILTIFVFILYGNTLTLDYALDDRLMITENTFTKSGFGGIKDILINDSFVGFFGEKKNLLTGGRYRPLSHIMFAVEYGLFGPNPFIGHLLNILFYALSCVVLLKVLKLLFLNYKGLLAYMPYLVVLFFTAHPLHTEIVANIKGRDDILTFLLSLLTLQAIIQYLDSKKFYYLAIAAVFYFLALMSKENSITFLGVIPVIMFFFFKLRFRDYILPMLLIGLTAFLFILLRFAVLGFELNIGVEKELLNNPFVNATTNEKYATIFYTMGIYLKLLLLPHPLTHDYYPFHIELVTWTSLKALLPLVIYLILGFYAVWGMIKKQLPALGVAIYLITFSIASNLVFNIGTFMNERFMFVPLLGFCIVMAYFIIFFVRKLKNLQNKHNSYLFTVALIILVLYSFKTISRNPAWKNDFTLFTTDVKVSVNSAKCNVSAGGVLIEESQKTEDKALKESYLQQAREYLKKGTEIHPMYVAGWVLYGNVFLYLELYEEALVCYENALKIAPQNKDALNNMAHLAQVTQTKNLFDFSIKAYNVLNQYEPLSFDYQFQKARAYEGKNSIDTAMQMLLSIIKNNPEHQSSHSKLGEMYGKYYNNIDKSLEHLLRAYELDTTDASNIENLGIAYGLKQNFEQSLNFFEKAMELNPEKAELYMNVSQTYKMMGNESKAQEFLLKAQQVQSGSY
ncbi:MAG: hypothetical protein PHT69_04810 [Bacteroidales bacterium]|nr:hypothetical protein [Bacteroidales bacterium]